MDKEKGNKNKIVTLPKIDIKTEPKKIVKQAGKGLSKMSKPILYSSMGMVGVASGLTAGVSTAICIATTLGVVSIISGIEIVLEHNKCKNINKMKK